MNLENLCVNTIRMLSVDQIEKANSGHPGLPLGASPMAFELFSNHLRHNPKKPEWINRDRFILSAGHGSAMLYSLLHLFGYGLSIEDLKNFRQIGSLTPGHPEYGHTVGVEATTGPLGQGLAMAVGMAIAEEKLAAMYNKDDLKIIDHYTYTIVGDGDLMEGITSEASSLAGTLKLKKLIILYDSNNITIEGSTDLAFTEDVRKRYESYGFDTFLVDDGNNLEEISKAIEEAKKTDRPAFIEIRTKIGYGSPRVGMAKSHGEPLGLENIKETRKYLEMIDEDFHVSKEAKDEFAKIIARLEENYNHELELENKYREKYPEEYEDLVNNFKGFGKTDYVGEILGSVEKDEATRVSSSNVLNHIAKNYKNLFGGSADLGPSNKTLLKEEAYFSKENRDGRNLTFGVRENAMGSISNGMLLHGGLRTYVSTFLVFSDYLKPALRMAALMNIPNLFIFTHDSIGVGEDGPTHQPIDQLAMLRSIPNMIVFRPADANETAIGYNVAMNSKNTPVTLILTRQNLKQLENTGIDAQRGAYIVKREEEELKKIIIATGSEVNLALEAAKDYKDVRVVSMPSMELFEGQSSEYQEEILPKNITKRISIEASSSFGWGKFTGLKGINIAVDTFGICGPAKEVFERFGFTVENVKKVIEEI